MGKKEFSEMDLKVYLVTDSRWLEGRDLADVVTQAIDGGATFVQLREKGASTEQLVRIAAPLVELCHARGIPFVINDDVEAARLTGADGVHVGQSDEACADARRALGDGAIVGVSAQTPQQALDAQAAGADYLGVGAVFATGTKKDAEDVSLARLREITEAVDVPAVAIGGIDAGNIRELQGSGIAGVAVVSAIMAAKDVKGSAAQISEEVERWL